MTKDDMEGWVTTQQAADILNVSPRRVRQLIDIHNWPHKYLNPRLLLIDRETVESHATEANRKGEA